LPARSTELPGPHVSLSLYFRNYARENAFADCYRYHNITALQSRLRIVQKDGSNRPLLI
jgi:hypothetical protein